MRSVGPVLTGAAVLLLLQSVGTTQPRQAVVVLETSRGVTAIDVRERRAILDAPGGLAAGDGSRVFHVVAGRPVAFDPSTGSRVWRGDAAGGHRVAAVSFDGGHVALAPPRGPGAYPAGRRITPIVITGPGSQSTRSMDVDGNVEPEAFSRDARSLFVVEYLPPLAPDRYRVRRLDLTTGSIVPVYTPDKHLQQAMRGVARVQASAPDGRRLYTVYTLLDAAGARRAFVHVLDLAALWAHCVDLPPEMASIVDDAAIAVGPDGASVYVAAGGRMAEIDAKALRVSRRAVLDLPGSGPARLAVGTDGTVFAGRDRAVAPLDGASMRPAPAWAVPGRLVALRPAADGHRLYATLHRSVATIDVRTGRVVEILDLPTNGGPVPSLRAGVQCAC